MRKILLAFVFAISTLVSTAQAEPPKNHAYCILQVFGPGHSDRYKGAFIVYDNLMVERRMLVDDSHVGYLKLVMESINAIKSKGFELVSSTMASTDMGMKSEYVFRKDE